MKVEGPNASNLTVGDPVTMLFGGGEPIDARVVRTFADGGITVECGPDRNRSRYMTHEILEGTKWARGHGPDVCAALLLTATAC